MHFHREDFIPAGCLTVLCHELDATLSARNSALLQKWKRFRPQTFPAHRPVDRDDECLPVDVQKQLVHSEIFNLPAYLFEHHWLDLEFRVNQDAGFATLRVYFLADDTCRGLVDKTSLGLQRARQRLIHVLDYSDAVWKGEKCASKSNTLSLIRGSGATDEDATLLQVFNSIPSPEPDLSTAGEHYLRDAMSDVLRSNVDGLETKLHPYQRRSTAVMLQRESEPGIILDPRLVTMQDRNGLTFYVDPVKSTILREPRHYDGIAGGILAEEMGAGKTLICLALILATRNFPTRPPQIYGDAMKPVRPRIGSLVDMAAACATRNAVPWRSYFRDWKRQLGYQFDRCEQALQRNPGYYFRPPPLLRRTGRHPVEALQPTKMYLSDATIVIVPNNLISQWKQEVAKHTTGLKICVLAKQESVPTLEELVDYDLILFSQSHFERLVKLEGGKMPAPLSKVHFKRCIVDEGHKLGNSKIGRRSNLLIGIDNMSFSSKWIVTGTPSHGLFGVDDRGTGLNTESSQNDEARPEEQEGSETSAEMERKDLERLGSITSLFLKARPWANSSADIDDGRADWGTYLLLPRHSKHGCGSWGCLTLTLNSLIVRHRLSDVGDLLPPVDEKITVLEGSYQDRLSLDLFAMMIIFNSVQSQRTDMDYFFHPRQRRSLLQIVHNLKQSSFFGASFFTAGEIVVSVETAEKFIAEGKVPISEEDSAHLSQAIALGRAAVDDKLRNLSNQYHDMPLLIEGPLGDVSHAWSLDGEGGDTICASASMLLSLQRLLSKAASDVETLNSLLNGGLIQEGLLERERVLAAQDAANQGDKKDKRPVTLAGNTKLGEDPRHRKSRPPASDANPSGIQPVDGLPASLRQTKLVSTVSAKLSYLVDSVLRHQDDEKIIIFYENENVAWYLASLLDMVRERPLRVREWWKRLLTARQLQVQHLIYAKSLSSERKAQYVHSFHTNDVFRYSEPTRAPGVSSANCLCRVLLMDLSQAAFGLDMRGASRIYFINPVLNPQVEAQAIGRVRRISQQRAVSVETLVLKDSIDEVILERKRHMTQAEHRQIKSLLDVRPIYNWIKNATILKLPDVVEGDIASRMVPLEIPQTIFGRGFGKERDADDGLITPDSPVKTRAEAEAKAKTKDRPAAKRKRGERTKMEDSEDAGVSAGANKGMTRPARRVRFS